MLGCRNLNHLTQICTLQRGEAKIGWIRVEDWLPPLAENSECRSETVLMTVEDAHGNHLVECGYYNYMFGGAWCYFFDDCNPEMFGEKVLAWAPMPKPFVIDRKE